MITATITTTEMARRGRKREVANDMAKEIAATRGDLSPEYSQKLAAFAAALQRSRTKALVEAGETGKAVRVDIDTNTRKHDRIRIGIAAETNGKFRMATVYFVERATGSIYGAKSELALNANRWFGTLDTVDLWDWSGEFPKPWDDSKFILTRTYGDCGHYRLRTEADNVTETEEVAVESVG